MSTHRKHAEPKEDPTPDPVQADLGGTPQTAAEPVKGVLIGVAGALNEGAAKVGLRERTPEEVQQRRIQRMLDMGRAISEMRASSDGLSRLLSSTMQELTPEQQARARKDSDEAHKLVDKAKNEMLAEFKMLLTTP